MDQTTKLSAPIFPEGVIEQFLQRRVCARCYGDLNYREAPDYSPANHIFEAFCPTCGEAWNYTTVSKAYAEQLGQEAIAAIYEVKINLPDLFPNPHHGKPATQLLTELGY